MTQTLRAGLLALMIAAAGSANGQEKGYNISGTVTGMPAGGYVYLTFQGADKAKPVMDSAIIKNGRFGFSGKVDGVVQAFVLAESNPVDFRKFLTVLLSPGELTLSLSYPDFSAGTFTGTPVQEEMNVLNQLKAPLMQELASLNVAYNKANLAFMTAAGEKQSEATLSDLKSKATEAKNALMPVQARLMAVEKEFVNTHPQGYTAAMNLSNGYRHMTYEDALARYQNLSAEVRASAMGQKLKDGLDGLRKGSPGSVAASFAGTELNGGTLNLVDYKGRYVLLDFWASWCVPCRAGNPHLISLYNKYRGKGFEIIGIADNDSSQDAWKKAVAQDKIGIWKHILRGYRGVNPPAGAVDVSGLYAVSALPTKILIDPKGMIVGRYLGGGASDEALDKKLAEIYPD